MLWLLEKMHVLDTVGWNWDMCFFLFKRHDKKIATDAAEIHKCSLVLAYTIGIQRVKLV